MQQTNGARVASGLMFLAGIWTLISPFFMGYNSTADVWVQFVLGIAVALFALIRLASPMATWPSLLNLLIGIWLIIAPFVFSATSTSEKWNEVIMGIIVAVLALISGGLSETAGETRGTRA